MGVGPYFVSGRKSLKTSHDISEREMLRRLIESIDNRRSNTKQKEITLLSELVVKVRQSQGVSVRELLNITGVEERAVSKLEGRAFRQNRSEIDEILSFYYDGLSPDEDKLPLSQLVIKFLVQRHFPIAGEPLVELPVGIRVNFKEFRRNRHQEFFKKHFMSPRSYRSAFARR